ncbi:MAG: hypothetical protein Q4A31_05320 [Corynebacterium sp.]|uniref:Rv1157c family protein n=1 Tax=Corynebacterium sp. TaxID=1720 RepID=UPI0026DCEC4F|nr:hypothetical protein [Corynebacterium sp.]MDO4761318.1 hypothetical protein [Corynebacterium sp.]
MKKPVAFLLSLALCFPVTAPAAQAQPSPGQLSSLSSMGLGLDPATIESLNPLDDLGRPKQQYLDQARTFAKTAPLPEQFRNAILSAVAFYEGGGNGGVEVPQTGPKFFQFHWPTVATNCIGGSLDSVGSGIAVPGPSPIPAPGAKDGETAFVFTALGTGAVRQSQMKVHWVNLSELRMGQISLSDHGLNPQGPATVTGTAVTGKGTIVAVMEGSVDTIEKESDARCSFIPTAAVFEVK